MAWSLGLGGDERAETTPKNGVGKALWVSVGKAGEQTLEAEQLIECSQISNARE